VKSILATATLISALFLPTLLAQPSVSAVENNYSYVQPGLPNYGIAQGSIFTLFGKNLANTPTDLQSVPLKTQLNGVSVNVTVSGTTVPAYLYYVTPNQIAGILPSKTPVGTGTITVVNNGQTSAAAPITVVASAVGLITLNGSGAGPVAAFDASNRLLSSTNAANPGDTIVLYGTGLGAAPGDESVQQTPVNLSTPIEVDIGGVSAKVAYHGRSIFPGLDQINVVVPSVGGGCYTSLVVVTGNYVSNFPSIPVAASGRICTDQSVGVMGTPVIPSGSTTARIGEVGLIKITTTTADTTVGTITIPGTTINIESGFATFTKITLPPNYDQYITAGSVSGITSIGSCTVYTFNSSTASAGTVTGATLPGVTSTSLNAGPFVNISGPNGKKAMPYQNGTYSAQLGGNTGTTTLPSFVPDTGGTFTFDNGSGGPDVGAFSTQLQLSPVTWTNMKSLTTVTRSKGVTLTWTGGDANSFVTIGGGTALVNGTQYLFGEFSCTAPATAHTFTVPAAVLLAIPASGSFTSGTITVPLPGSLSLTTFNNLVSFNAPGLDYAYKFAYTDASGSVIYQ
jgi:uncharacterized protein (TIGR03437 family)